MRSAQASNTKNHLLFSQNTQIIAFRFLSQLVLTRSIIVEYVQKSRPIFDNIQLLSKRPKTGGAFVFIDNFKSLCAAIAKAGGLFPRLYFLPNTVADKLCQIHAALTGGLLPCYFLLLRYAKVQLCVFHIAFLALSSVLSRSKRPSKRSQFASSCVRQYCRIACLRFLRFSTVSFEYIIILSSGLLPDRRG